MQAIESPKAILQDSTVYELKTLKNGEECVENVVTKQVYVFEKTLRNYLKVSADTFLRIRRQHKIGEMVGQAITGRLSPQVILLGSDVPWVIREIIRSHTTPETKKLASETLAVLVEKYDRDICAWLEKLYAKVPLIHVGTLAKHIGVTKNQLMTPDWLNLFTNRGTKKDPHYSFDDSFAIVKMFLSRAIKPHPQIEDLVKAIELEGVDSYFSRLQPNGLLKLDPETEKLQRRALLMQKAAEAEAKKLELEQKRLATINEIEQKQKARVSRAAANINATFEKIQKDFKEQLISIQKEIAGDDNLEVA